MIGIFDSGSGGLTVMRAIRNVLPSSDILYFGDIKNAPYGSRSREDLSLFTVSAMKLLHERGANSIVSACNSVSASLAISLFDAFSIQPQHLIEMVGPTVSYFRGSTARLLLCATPATISSHIYQSAFHMIGKEIDVLPIDELAAAIEFGEGDEKIDSIIKKNFAAVGLSKYDALVLACTHYPLASENFRRILGDSMHLFDPAIAVAERVEAQLWPREAGYGKTRYLISKESQPFRALIERLFPGEKYEIEIIE